MSSVLNTNEPRIIRLMRSISGTSFKFLLHMFRPPQPFPSILQEYQFRLDYAKKFSGPRRAALLLSLITWLLYYAWDVYHGVQIAEFRAHIAEILTLRTIGAIFIISMLLVSLKSSFLNERLTTILLSTTAVGAYSVITAMMVVSPFPYNYLFYFVGLPLVMTFTFSLLRLRAKVVINISILFILISCLALPFASSSGSEPAFMSIRSYYYIAAVTYLLSFVVVGCAVCVELERSARKAFSRERELSRASIDLSKKNRELEFLNTALKASQKDTEAKTTAIVTLKDELRVLAEQKNAAKSKFLADAAHDLRQPMQALANLLEAARHALDKEDIEKCGQMLTLAQDASRLTSSSFNAVLDISRLESGFIKAEYTIFDLNQVVNEVLLTFRPIAEENEIVIRTRFVNRSRNLVRSDRHLLTRAITNIVANAIKYRDAENKEKCFVMVGMVRFSNRVRLDVIDNGIGIDIEEWNNIFEPFVQLNNPQRDRDKGMGLGLSIVNSAFQILEEHRIEMKSTKDVGTRFSLEIPTSDVCVMASGAEYSSPELQISCLEGAYVIYVEDDNLVRGSLTALFEVHGILYEAFSSFLELEQSIASIERIPDLIVSDHRLPDNKSAHDVISIISEKLEAQPPIIIMTGEVVHLDYDTSGGLLKIIHKPVDPNLVLETMNSLVSGVQQVGSWYNETAP